MTYGFELRAPIQYVQYSLKACVIQAHEAKNAVADKGVRAEYAGDPEKTMTTPHEVHAKHYWLGTAPTL